MELPLFPESNQSRRNPHFLKLLPKLPNKSLSSIISSGQHPLTEISLSSPWCVLPYCNKKISSNLFNYMCVFGHL